MNRPPPPERRPPAPDRYERQLIDQCTSCGAPLADGSSFCTMCGASQRARHTSPSRPRPRSRRPWWIPAGIAAGGLAAIIGGALVGVALLGDPDRELASASATAHPSASASASATDDPDATESAAAASADPSASQAPTPSPAAIIPNRAIAEVTTDDLNLRAAGNRSAEVLTVLKRGQRLFIIGEPSQVDDLRWYRVGIVNDPSQCAESCGLIGFVATPLPEEDRWIARREVSCPASPMTAEALARLQPLEALSCYGRNEIAVTGTMELPMHGHITPYRHSPAWLRPHFGAYMRHAWWVGFVVPPDSSLAMPDHGTIVRATGHFEHPSAIDCRASVDPTFFGGTVPDDVPAIDRARAVLDCRATFVWTGYEVLGTEQVEASAPPPDNDAPSAAATIAIGQRIEVDTSGAAPEPELPCLDAGGHTLGLGKTVWFGFMGTGGPVTVDTAGSGFDTMLGVYRDPGGGDRIPVDCVDDVETLQARITIHTDADHHYLVQVGGYYGASGHLAVTVRE